MLSSMVYYLSILKSRHVRGYLERNGVDNAVKKYPYIGEKSILDAETVHSIISQRIMSNEPFMVGRFGSIELKAAMTEELGLKNKAFKSLEILCNNAGFFPKNENLLPKFSQIMIDSLRQSDVQGVWYLPLEEYAINKYLKKDAVITEGRYLEPWFSKHPWTSALKGKRVLVIHPFVDTIKYQYNNYRLDLFPSEEYLPEFELQTVKAVQTIAGNKDERFSNWFDALEYMYLEALKVDFDIALIGCGAYGYPLASMLKNSGKQAIHMGGVLQAMFGIKGKRWEVDNNPIVRNLYNEKWCRPGENEIPKDIKRVENGCYW